jgi:hypothetical protein
MPACAQTYMVTTIGGRGKLPYGGDGQSAAKVDLFDPGRLAYDGNGNLYFAESYYNRVLRVAANGTLSTAAGNGQSRNRRPQLRRRRQAGSVGHVRYSGGYRSQRIRHRRLFFR